MFKNSPIRKSTAVVLLLSFLAEWLTPLNAYALTSGPSQPEMQSFEPVGTTDMVNAFSGDFTYNIPLLDVEGYPVNIAYHSGVGVEDEASWVGLGWNINPGTINHGVRGLPDDFNGEVIEKEIEINNEENKTFTLGASLEILGVDGTNLAAVTKKFRLPAPALNLGITVNNYTGVSSSLGYSVGGGIRNEWMSLGVNMNVNLSSNNGADVGGGLYGSIHGKKTGLGKNGAYALNGAINGNFGQTYNSRQGLKYTSFGVNGSSGGVGAATEKYNEQRGQLASLGINSSTVPISSQNFVPVITNAASMTSQFTQLKVGFEASGLLISPVGSLRKDVTEFEKDGSRRGFGYFNLQNANKNDITDFTRDRDGRFNRSMKYLPSGSMTYDVYGVNGQGTAGNFRSFRNDVGSVYDPYTQTATNSRTDMVEIGVGNLFEAGYDYTEATTTAVSGPWDAHQYPFSGKEAGNLYEPHYFKQAGELTESSQKYFDAIGGHSLLPVKSLQGINKAPLKNKRAGYSSGEDFWNRTKRANQFYFFTAAEAGIKGVSPQRYLQNYSGYGPNRTINAFSRIDADRKAHHASEFTQILPDGRRYIYGLPAMNKKQIEHVVSCKNIPGTNNGTVDLRGSGGQNIVPYGSGKASAGGIGQDFSMKTSTPAYAHNYLLTNVLSPDYSDLTGDGITDDDLGSYTKFNYSRKETNYGWRAPYQAGIAQYDKGVASDCHDDKATFIGGSKEIWVLHSIETKNYIAEFYTSERSDAKGANDVQVGASGGSSYKLDRIALYNKAEWRNTQVPAVPIKQVFFTYDYTLCKGVPNHENPTSAQNGKLTLKAISVKFGNSDMGLLSPYRFVYSSNPDYDLTAKDRWGGYKAQGANLNQKGINLSNHEHPYVIQDKTQADMNASAWNLTEIKLPSGGGIKVSYEADDYAYVQDKRAMEMFKVAGVGPSEAFTASDALYKDVNNPYLYVYFERKKAGGNFDEWYNELRKTYLGNDDIVQYNFKVKMSSQDETTKSCGIPLEDHVKGYAKVVAVGACPESATYAYVQLEPRQIDAVPAATKIANAFGGSSRKMQINPVTLAAIFYAKYYNNNALYPGSEILKPDDKALITQLISSVLDLVNFFKNPISEYIRQSKAKHIDLSQSFVRLCSQGYKLGGGHRVKRIEFADNWADLSTGGQPAAIYGSTYDYTTTDPTDPNADPDARKRISSGVASYEPLYGGDENPFKEPIATDRIGQESDFPVVTPTELTMEGPIGESLFPGASVGYSKVTVTSIHKNEGRSSQTIQEEEFYTARDFPVRVKSGDLEILEDEQLGTFDLSPSKKESYRVGQSYALFFNDMHGKVKQQTTYVARDGNEKTKVSYKKYKYFTNGDNTLRNRVPCVSINEERYNILVDNEKTIGVETDLMIDNRAKDEYSESKGFAANLNVFFVGFPLPIPSGMPHIPEDMAKHFSSVVSTKVVQQYGILQSVETFDKGAAVVMTNERFDANTGLALVTKVSTEHNDNEIQVKYPAYWAYQGMGAAAHNILYEEYVKNVNVVNDTMYIRAADHRNFNVGDELLMSYSKSCALPNYRQTRKLWIIDKTNEVPKAATTTLACQCYPDPNEAVSYSVDHYTCGATHSKIPINYSDAITSSIVHDKICKLNRSQIFGYKLNLNEPNNDRNNEAVSSFTQRIDFTKSQNQSPSNLFIPLTDILYGNNGAAKYPIEELSYNYIHASDYSSWDNAKVGITSGYYTDFEKKNWHYNDLNVGIKNYKISLYEWGKANRHGDNAGWSTFTIKGNVGDKNSYNSVYASMPIVGKTKKIVNIEISFNDSTDAYLTNTITGQTRFAYTLASAQSPYDVLTNNFNSDKYVIHLPYDTSYPASITASQVASIRVSPFVYEITNPLTILTMKIDENPKWHHVPQGTNAFIPFYGYHLKIPFPSMSEKILLDGTEYDYLFFKRYRTVSVTAEIVNRPQLTSYAKDVLVALPHHRNDSSHEGQALPDNDFIQNAHLKVMRSGRRNQLLETVQNVSMVSANNNAFIYRAWDPYPPHDRKFQGVVNLSAQTFTDQTAKSEVLANPFSIYNNPFVTGNRGTYRADKQYDVRKARAYNTGTGTKEGLMNDVYSFWSPIPNTSVTGANKYISCFLPSPSADVAAMWAARIALSLISPWGLPLQVQDAAGNVEATLYGYDNQLPVSKVANAAWDDCLYENFEEDIPAVGINSNIILRFFQNNLHQSVYFGMGNPPSMSANLLTSDLQKHTGQKSLQVAGAISIPFPLYNVPPATVPEGATPPFHFRPGKKYLYSYWQQVPQNTSNPNSLPKVSLSTAGVTNGIAKAKTPPIDGWVLYEGSITLPAYPTGNMVNLDFTPGVYDDLRILPAEANMKCFVYHPVTRKLAATLDENHMATLLEYDAEGKLVRIKKETERGILTIKESRSGVHSVLEAGATSVDLKN